MSLLLLFQGPKTTSLAISAIGFAAIASEAIAASGIPGFLGVAASGQIGSLTVSAVETVTGVSCNGLINVVSTQVNITLPSVAAISQAGIIAKTIRAPSVTASAFIGTITTQIALALISTIGTGQVGVITEPIKNVIAGVASNGRIDITIKQISIIAVGVFIIGQIGIATGSIGDAITLIGVSGLGLSSSGVAVIDLILNSVTAIGISGDLRFVKKLTVSLYSDAGGIPDQLIAVLGTISDVSGITRIRLPLVTPIPLAGNTRYWIQLSDVNGTTLKWVAAGDPSGTGVLGESWHKPTSSGLNATTVSYQMQVVVTESGEPLGISGVGSITAEVDAVFQGVAGSGEVGEASLTGHKLQLIVGVVGAGTIHSLVPEIDIAIAGITGVGYAEIISDEVKPLLADISCNGIVGDITHYQAITIPSVNASGAVNISTAIANNIASVSATGEVDDVVVAIDVQAIGTTANGIAGDFVEIISGTLIGTEGNSLVNDLSIEISVLLTSVEAIGYAGEIGGVFVELEIVTLETVCIGQCGTLVIEIDVISFGVAGIGQADATIPEVSGFFGVSGTGQIDLITAEIDVLVAGVEGETQASPISIEIDVISDIVAAIGQVGEFIAEIDVEIVGIEASGFIDQVVAEDATLLTDVEATGYADSFGIVEEVFSSTFGVGQIGDTVPEIDVSSEVSAIGLIGSFVPQVEVSLISVAAPGEVGTLGLSEISNPSVPISGVVGTGKIGKVKAGKYKLRSGRGAPRRGDPAPAASWDDRETLTQKMARWRKSVEDLLEIPAKDTIEVELEISEEPIEPDFSFLASLDEIAKPIDQEESIQAIIQESRWRILAEAEDDILLGLSDDDDAQLGLIML